MTASQALSSEAKKKRTHEIPPLAGSRIGAPAFDHTRETVSLPLIPHWGIRGWVQTVAETPTFSRQADKLFNEEERRALIDFLAENPLAGDEIPGTGGVRKLRVPASGRGKRGGARIIYYYLNEAMPIYALLAYAKATQSDLTPREKRTVAALAAALKAAWKETK